MDKKQARIEQLISLRTEAESMVARFYPKETLSEPAEKLLHELMVHKVELELQNEELRLVNASMTATLEHYRALYEYSPVGYLTISREGLIIEANLTGCGLLCGDRINLINQPFVRFIAPQNADRWHFLFLDMLSSSANEKIEINLEMIDHLKAGFSAHLICSTRKVDAITELWIAFTRIENNKLDSVDV